MIFHVIVYFQLNVQPSTFFFQCIWFLTVPTTNTRRYFRVWRSAADTTGRNRQSFTAKLLCPFGQSYEIAPATSEIRIRNRLNQWGERYLFPNDLCLNRISANNFSSIDPEEFLHCLLSQTLRAEPFLKLSSGQEAYHHQLFVEKDDKLLLPSVQQLFEQSFLSSGIKLKEVPPCLIIQMPRFGKSYKMYPHVLPSLLLDITDILENCKSFV